MLIGGCASVGTSNVDPAYRPGANGLLVASVTTSGYNPGTLWVQVVRASAATETVASIPVNDPAYGLDWRVGDPAVTNGGEGRIAVVELAPGEYELRRWVINVDNRAAYSSRRALGYRFNIVAGKASYVGNLHVDIQRSAAESLPFATTLEDKRERDLPIVQGRYSGVRAEHMVFAGESAQEERPAPTAARRGPAATRIDDLQGLLPGK